MAVIKAGEKKRSTIRKSPVKRGQRAYTRTQTHTKDSEERKKTTQEQTATQIQA